jgi:hypothetical protein
VSLRPVLGPLWFAAPLVQAFASDARLYEVLGVNVFHDGRLPSNTGSWGFVTWSPSRHELLQVNVTFTGATTTEIRSRATAPSANGQPIPSDWANSTVIFQAAEPHRPAGRSTAQTVVFNRSTWRPGRRDRRSGASRTEAARRW